MKSAKHLYGAMTTAPLRPSLGHTKEKMNVASKMFVGPEDENKAKKLAKGGSTCRGDGIAQRGKTKGRFV